MNSQPLEHESPPITTRPRPGPIKILQSKFYATLFIQAFWLDANKFQPIKMLGKITKCKIYAEKSL